MNLASLLIVLGIILVLMGILWHFGSKFLPLGKLPGDIAIEKENFKFYFPLGTSIVISIILSIVLWVMNYLRQ